MERINRMKSRLPILSIPDNPVILSSLHSQRFA